MVGKLVGGWLRDVGGGRGEETDEGVRGLLDMLIDHCYRWLTNPYSKMYEVLCFFLFCFFLLPSNPFSRVASTTS